jgi:hypothetical protein
LICLVIVIKVQCFRFQMIRVNRHEFRLLIPLLLYKSNCRDCFPKALFQNNCLTFRIEKMCQEKRAYKDVWKSETTWSSARIPPVQCELFSFETIHDNAILCPALNARNMITSTKETLQVLKIFIRFYVPDA